MRQFFRTLAIATFLAASAFVQPSGADAEEFVTMKLTTGEAVIKLRPDLAPNHVARIKKLVSEKFYDGIIFHRVLDGFMAQTGDPTGTGTGGSKYPELAAEFSKEPFRRGTVGAARTHPDSGDSQFFICFGINSCTHLQGQYSIWGQVVKGMGAIDKVIRNGQPGFPSKIVSMRMGRK